MQARAQQCEAQIIDAIDCIKQHVHHDETRILYRIWNWFEFARVYTAASCFTSTMWQDRLGPELQVLISRRLTSSATIIIWDAVALIQRLASELAQTALDWETDGVTRHKIHSVPYPDATDILYVDYDLCDMRFESDSCTRSQCNKKTS